MARYRKLEPRVWVDDKFLSLSAPGPNGQTLWLYLLTSPFTTSIPGLYIAGKAAIAEALGWDDRMDEFEAAFQSILEAGMMEYDKKTRLVWIPKAIEHNLPESPNVVVSWKHHYTEMTDCALLRKAVSVISETICPDDAKGKAFREALTKAFGKALPKETRKPSRKTIGKTTPNQEQEQEQEGFKAFPASVVQLQDKRAQGEVFPVVDNSVENFDRPFGSDDDFPTQPTNGKDFVADAVAIRNAKQNPVEPENIWSSGEASLDDYTAHLEQSG